MEGLHSKSNHSAAKFPATIVASTLGLLLVSIGLLSGTLQGSGTGGSSQKAASPNNVAKGNTKPNGVSIVAQGRLQPAEGTLKLSALPGDRIERIHAKVGDVVASNSPLVTLESAKAKGIELEIAQLRLEEAVQLHETALREAQAAVETAELKVRTARLGLQQSQGMLGVVEAQKSILNSLDEQLRALEGIRENPKLRGAVGTLEIAAKRNQKIQAQSEFDKSLLEATQANETAQAGVSQAEMLLRNASQVLEDLRAHPRYKPLEKQIELLQVQREQGTEIGRAHV